MEIEPISSKRFTSIKINVEGIFDNEPRQWGLLILQMTVGALNACPEEKFLAPFSDPIDPIPMAMVSLGGSKWPK